MERQKISSNIIFKFILLHCVVVLSACTLDHTIALEDPSSISGPIENSLNTSTPNIELDENSNLNIIVTLKRKLTADATLTWSILGGTATDFLETTNTVEMVIGDESALINILPINDFIFENTKTYTLNIAGGSEHFDNELQISINLNDNDSPVGDPTLAVSDIITGSNTYAISQTINISIGNDATATKWCISETQIIRPDSGDSICVGGQGPSNGWHTSAPTSFDLSSGGGTKTLYTWISVVGGNMSAGSITGTIELDETIPLAPNLSLSDTLLGSTTDSYATPISLSVSGDIDATQWCLIEQSMASPDPTPPIWGDVCFQGSRPTQVAVSVTGNRKVFVFVQDQAGNISPAGVDSINYALNQDPTLAGDGPFYVGKDASSANIDVLANDSDPESEGLSISSKTNGSNGATVAIAGSGASIDYQPGTGFSGVDSFTYTVEDPRGASSTATVTVYVMAPFSWTGLGVGNDWSTTGNWCGTVSAGACLGGGPPGGTDIAIFDATCTNCNPSITTLVNILGIEMNTGYSGTITQTIGGSQTETITIGTSGWIQASGTFVGGDAKIDINRTFNLLGGQFTATTDEFEVGYTTNSDVTMFTLDGGTFIHNNGTFRFKTSIGNCSLFSARKHRMELNNTSLDFNNFIIDGGFDACHGGYSKFILNTGSQINVLNQLDLFEGAFYGSMTLKGNYVVGTSNVDCSSGIIEFDGTGVQTYTTSINSRACNVVINKPSGSVVPEIGTTDLSFASLDLQQGVFTAPSNELRLGIESDTARNLLLIAPGTTFNGAMTTLHFYLTKSSCNGNSGDPVFLVDLDVSLSINDLQVTQILGCGESTLLRVASGDTLKIDGDMILSGSWLRGVYELKGNLNLAATDINAATTPGTIVLTGTTDQIYTSLGGQGPIIEVNKPSGQFIPNIATTDLWLAGLSLTQGDFIAPTGTLKIGHTSNSTVTAFEISPLGNFIPNNGTLHLYGRDGGCGGSSGNFVTDVDNSLTVNHLLMSGTTNCGESARVTIAAGDKLTVLGNFTHGVNISIYGVFEAQGAVTVDAGALGGTATISLIDTANQNLTNNGGLVASGLFTVNKAAGTVTLLTNFDLNGGGQDLYLQQGLWDLSGFNLTVNDILTMDATTNIDLNGGILTVGGAPVTAGPYDNGTVN